MNNSIKNMRGKITKCVFEQISSDEKKNVKIVTQWYLNVFLLSQYQFFCNPFEIFLLYYKNEEKVYYAIKALLDLGVNPNLPRCGDKNFIFTLLETDCSLELKEKIFNLAIEYGLDVKSTKRCLNTPTILHQAIYNIEMLTENNLINDRINVLILFYNLLLKNGFNLSIKYGYNEEELTLPADIKDIIKNIYRTEKYGYYGEGLTPSEAIKDIIKHIHITDNQKRRLLELADAIDRREPYINTSINWKFLDKRDFNPDSINYGIFKMNGISRKIEEYQDYKRKDYISQELYDFGNKFESVTMHKNGMCVVENGGLFGLYKMKPKGIFTEKLPISYKEIYIVGEYCEISSENSSNVYDCINNKWVLSSNYDEVHVVNNGIQVRKGNLWGAFNLLGEEILPILYTEEEAYDYLTEELTLKVKKRKR